MSNAFQILQHLQNCRDGIAARPAPLVTHHLAPTNPMFADNDNDKPRSPTGASKATRNVKHHESETARRSPAHCYGALVDIKSDRAIQFESKLERDLATILLADRSVADLHEQPRAANHVDRAGTSHSHTPDFHATKVDGTRVVYDVKPSIRVERSGIKDVLREVRDQNPGYADRFVLATDKEITRARVVHAEWILWARRGRNEDDIQAVMPLVTALKGAVRMRALADATGLGGRGFCALVNLIDDRVLQVVGPTAIGDRALVQFNPESSR